ncbi:MAG: hypothetical protein Q7T53_00745 [Deltaproteobacteria bacterium]|nr:hypothetical protein [Deltaproteobacteria bacterium]
MANNKKLTIQTSKRAAITITRSAFKADRLVYIAIANKALKYRHGTSKIVYIGTTKAGASRIAGSAAARASQLFELHGVTELTFFIITCAARQAVKTWHKLEVGLILTFRELYGEPPKCNTKGKNQKWNDERDYFTDDRLVKVIEKYSEYSTPSSSGTAQKRAKKKGAATL